MNEINGLAEMYTSALMAWLLRCKNEHLTNVIALGHAHTHAHTYTHTHIHTHTHTRTLTPFLWRSPGSNLKGSFHPGFLKCKIMKL